jgi:heterodisulfide reductase subunit D
MIYFRGCVVREKLGNISQATEKILKRSGVDYRVLDDETCCGSFLLRTGFQSEALAVMEKTLDDLKGEKILVSCAGCYNTLKNDYKKLLGVELDVVHTSQFFNDLINEGKLKVKKNPVNVTYHDPCHLGRHCGVYDEPREVLNKTANLIEMERNREHSRCCGAGAGVKSAFPEAALKVAEKRIKEAENTGSNLIVTSCSFCILNLKNALEIFKKNKKESTNISGVFDVSEIILMEFEDEEV